MFVHGHSFDKRWHFWLGAFPVGMFILMFILVVPDTINWWKEFFKGVRYYIR